MCESKQMIGIFNFNNNKYQVVAFAIPHQMVSVKYTEFYGVYVIRSFYSGPAKEIINNGDHILIKVNDEDFILVDNNSISRGCPSA